VAGTGNTRKYEGAACGCMPERTEDVACSWRRCLWMHARANRRRSLQLKALFVAAYQREQKTLISVACHRELETVTVAECHGKLKQLHVAKCNSELKTQQCLIAIGAESDTCYWVPKGTMNGPGDETRSKTHVYILICSCYFILRFINTRCE
jgi:hypothetical protein